MYAKAIGAGLVVLGFLVCYAMGRSDGAKLEASEINAERAQEARENTIAIEGAYKRKAETEAKWQAAFSKAGKDFEGKLNAKDKALAAALAGKRLRDPYSEPKTCGDTTGKTAANPEPANAGGTELSVEFDRFLKSEASRADKVVLKLNLCIDTLEAERNP